MSSVEGTLEEMEGYVSYFEDLPAECVRPAGNRLARISDRLQKLKESLNGQDIMRRKQ